MGGVDALVAEHCADLVNLFDAADNAPLQVQLGRNTQRHIEVESVQVRVERAGRGAAVHRLQDWRLDLEIPTLIKRRAQRSQHLTTRSDHLSRFRAHDQVDISLADPILVGQRLVRHRQRAQCLGRDAPIVGEHRQFSALGRDHLTLDEHQVAEVDVGLPGGERVGADPVEGEHGLQLGVPFTQAREAQLAGVPDEDDPPGDTDLHPGGGVGREIGVRCAHVGERRGTRYADRPRRAVRVGHQPVVLRPTDPQLLREFGVVTIEIAVAHPANLLTDVMPTSRLIGTVPPSGGSGRLNGMTNTAVRTGDGIRLTGLTKSFRGPGGPVRAVRGIDVSIPSGETVALLGPNGAGKSTTIDMMLGLLAPDSGTIEIFGVPTDRAIAEGRIGAMLQVGGVAQYLSVRELLTMVASLYPNPLPVDEVIELTRIGDLADRRTNKLSGGQTQRLRFAIGIIGNPDLLVLDEPTVAMDVEARRDFWSTMRRLRGRRKDGGLRHPLPGGGRRLRRSDHPDGARPGGRRRTGHRDQGDGRSADDPRDAARRRRRVRWASCRA